MPLRDGSSEASRIKRNISLFDIAKLCCTIAWDCCVRNSVAPLGNWVLNRHTDPCVRAGQLFAPMLPRPIQITKQCSCPTFGGSNACTFGSILLRGVIGCSRLFATYNAAAHITFAF